MNTDEAIQRNPKGCWRMCAGATLVLFCIVGLTINAFSVYLPSLRQACQLTNTQNSNVLLVRSLFAFASLFLVGAYYEKLEIRLGMTVATLLGAASLALYAWADSFATLCLAAAIGGLAYGLGGMYPASLLVHRWVPQHGALALGICAASTGAATILGAPIITALVQRVSLSFSLLAEAALLLVCAAAAFAIIRNYPAGAAPLPHPARFRFSLRINWMFAAVVATGVIGNTAFQFFSMHYNALGFSAYQVSALVSVVGLALAASKFLFGEAVDHWGTYRSNWLFFGSTILGCILCFAGSSYPTALAAMVLFGLGLAVTTVGLTVYAEDLSAPEEFEDTVRQYQVAYLLGALLFGSAPGVIADRTGDYRLFYVLVTVLTVFALAVIQVRYRKKQRASLRQ